MRTLVLGFGNPGRLDDGLGPAVVEALRAYELPGVTMDADYQLRVEDAAEIAGYDAARCCQVRSNISAARVRPR